MEVALHLQAMQLDYARQAVVQAQTAPVAAAAAAGNTQPVSDVILELSAAARQLLTA